MDSSRVRKIFLEYFKAKKHHITPSSSMVVRDDPTLMFTNAGMNQFKDIFLGNTDSTYNRIANTQKCLRVSGKHNDLEEVGMDTYHHTMFEMLGNWSFGDYFKKETIAWAWELLAEVYKIPKENLYVTVFGGDKNDNLRKDIEAYEQWKTIVPEERILFGSKKDNFWEMGVTGPCGPCSEIHIDIRDEEEKKKIKGRDLVNKNHPEVIELWNLVFIEFNRKATGELVQLPKKHVDTGMGFERLSMVLQGKKSNYDTDIFQPIIKELSKITGFTYGPSEQVDIAMRVIADHLRAISFAIADGQLPSNIGAGYVIRRILRRAVRYGFTYLNQKEPFINKLVPVLVDQMKAVFPELATQQELVQRVISEEELSFLRTLSLGIKRFEQYIHNHPNINNIEGFFAFELFDTYGFPIDLTQLMAKERGWSVDMEGFTKRLEEQKERSRQATTMDTGDWTVLFNEESEPFLGYDTLETTIRISQYRKVKIKGKEWFQLVFDQTPFYAESGGQIGDKGYIERNGEKIPINDTKKENNLIIHYASELPAHLTEQYRAVVDSQARIQTACNHSATHLLHHALREVLGTHVEQKGSFVGPDHLRFDFNHFQKVEKDELTKIEALVNARIRDDIVLDEKRSIPMKEALEMGAIAFFGEKYGEQVRVIRFADSIELCGGTHVHATGQIGFFKITSEGAIASGIRRIEAITAITAEKFIASQLNIIQQLKTELKSTNDLVKAVQSLLDQNNLMQKKIEQLTREKADNITIELTQKVEQIGDIHFIGAIFDMDASELKELAFKMKQKVENLFLILGSSHGGKASLAVMISENLLNEYTFHAGNIIREFAKEIQGGGGGQPYFATAGGKNPDGIDKAIEKARKFVVRSVG